MTTLQEIKKVANQKSIHISFKKDDKEQILFNEIMRRVTLTQSDVSKVIKEYCFEGVKNDVFLQQFR